MLLEPETGNADEHLVGYKTVIAKVNWESSYMATPFAFYKAAVACFLAQNSPLLLFPETIRNIYVGPWLCPECNS